MKNKLLARLGVAFVFLATLSITCYGQQDPRLKTEAGSYDGHQLYKMTKIFDNNIAEYGNAPKRFGDNAIDRAEAERLMLVNPYTGKFPDEIGIKEVEFAKTIESFTEDAQTPEEARFQRWGNRGPFNVGGRTRALAIDRTNENVILAGGVSGGLWRSEDGGATWRKITKRFQHPSITCIVQDPRPGKAHIWYYGTGEGVGNSASAAGAFYQGNGVYRSFNGGRSFFVSRSTKDDDPVEFTPFDLVTNIAVHPATGDVYVSTRDGVHKSTDFGRNFTQVLEGGFPNWTEVIVTTSGTLYAAIEATGTPNAGVFTSTDGDTWTNITPAGWSPFTGRTVLGFAPSSENIVFALAENELGTLGFLWEYNADEPDSTAWTDLSANLPALGGSVGSLNTQTSYNLIVRVHPTNPNLVFLGGTNLYRSFTGFRTPAGQESWIGGYSPLNDVSLYTNQHPDQHELIFYPSDPNRALSANDGGVYRAEDITEISGGIEPVTWTDLNNGYLTTQPYIVAFDPESTEQDLLAGFQDNGTWFTDSEDPTAPWIEDFGGDGSYAAIADGGRTRYVSAQRGVVFRLNFDSLGAFESFTRVQPAGATGFGFIAPFILDSRNDNIMYMPAGNRIWRNNDLDGIPLFSNATTSVNWTEMTNSIVPGNVVSLDVSTFPEANKLYFGTSTGGIYRIDNANIDGSALVDLSTGKGLPPGNVVCVTVDPTNSDRVFAVFSNYSIPSIFYSEDAGETWSDISGNLEENPDGTGVGPSVRWLAVEGNAEGYYVGTSVGLYYARTIRPGNQRWWRRWDAKIGETVVAQVKTRKDGFVAAAVHGNGLFSAVDFVRRRDQPELSSNFLLNDYSVPENAPDTTISIAGLFTFEEDEGRRRRWWWHQDDSDDEITVTLTNSNPGLVTATLVGDEIQISYAADTLGSASIGLIASTSNETVAEGFTITIAEFPIYEQFEAGVGSRPSQNFLDFGAIAQTAADFVVPAGQNWTLERVFAAGGANNAPLLTSATVVIYDDGGGVPGAEVYNSGAFAPISNPASTNLDLELPAAVTLGEGTYWVSVYVNLNFLPNATQWFWTTQATVVGQEGFFRDQANLFGAGATDWTPASLFGGVTDQVFQFYGSISDAQAAPQTNANLDTFLGETSLPVELKIWPNPSASSFSLQFGAEVEGEKQIAIYDLKGNVLLERVLDANTSDFVWDASARPTGLYLIKVATGNGSAKVFSVLKR